MVGCVLQSRRCARTWPPVERRRLNAGGGGAAGDTAPDDWPLSVARTVNSACKPRPPPPWTIPAVECKPTHSANAPPS
eukprot:355417-Chlamydomonas_euryale.AAC.5